MKTNTTPQRPSHLPAAQAVAGGSLTLDASALIAMANRSRADAGSDGESLAARILVARLGARIASIEGEARADEFYSAIGFDHLRSDAPIQDEF